MRPGCGVPGGSAGPLTDRHGRLVFITQGLHEAEVQRSGHACPPCLTTVRPCGRLRPPRYCRPAAG